MLAWLGIIGYILACIGESYFSFRLFLWLLRKDEPEKEEEKNERVA
jgi:hypothetical protein